MKAKMENVYAAPQRIGTRRRWCVSDPWFGGQRDIAAGDALRIDLRSEASISRNTEVNYCPFSKFVKSGATTFNKRIRRHCRGICVLQYPSS
jgi:hypothetical protein